MQLGEAPGTWLDVIRTDQCRLGSPRRGQWSKPRGDEVGMTKCDLALGTDHDSIEPNLQKIISFNRGLREARIYNSRISGALNQVSLSPHQPPRLAPHPCVSPIFRNHVPSPLCLRQPHEPPLALTAPHGT